ncbi:MAG: dihydroneopterin aldolase [Richelia sp.]|nr:dihydroneopterin aldolase [Richelia sp.]CDN14150.1 Dihydroneopterin aldolase [Richelia intracellularis]
MDQIRITDIRCYGYTGFFAEEQVLGQWFQVDLTMDLDLLPSGETDDLNQTLNYCEAIEKVKNLVEGKKFALLEKLASRIAEDILSLNLVKKVRVELTKLAAPIPNFGGEITIDITRGKETSALHKP